MQGRPAALEGLNDELSECEEKVCDTCKLPAKEGKRRDGPQEKTPLTEERCV